jgi:uncharacterized protein (TIGR03437 family)
VIARLLLSVALSGPVFAQGLSYTLLRADGPQPSPRFDAAIAYDTPGRQIFVFGGQDTQPLNDLWAYSLARRQWTSLTPSNPPPARFGHTLVFDSARRRLIVFGGQASGFFSDVWAYDIGAAAWQQLSRDEGGPSRRYGHSAIYETARDRVVISHGFTDAGRFDDTWAFSLTSNTWTNLNPAGPRPLRRCLHNAAYDAAAAQMFLYGGCSSGSGPCPQGDLWSLDLNANRWTEIPSTPAPPARERYGMEYDAARGRLVVFAGNARGLVNDTWEFDPRARSWRQPVLAGPAPAPRHRHETTVAPDRNTIFFFGGETAAGRTNELWMLGPGFAVVGPEIAPGGIRNAFSGEGGPIAPEEFVSIYGSGFDVDASVEFNGSTVAPLYAGANQINVLAPRSLAGAAEARVVVTAGGARSEAVTAPVAASAPGLFPKVWNEDGSVNSETNAAARGSVIVVYATGLNEPAGVQAGGVDAEVLFSGPPAGIVGVTQINLRLPLGLPSGQVRVTLAGTTSVSAFLAR